MPIAFSCAACGRHYHVLERLAGQKLKCKGCGAGVEVPAPRRSPEALVEARTGGSPGGTAAEGIVHRYAPRARDFRAAAGDAAAARAIAGHVEAHLGRVTNVLHELISD